MPKTKKKENSTGVNENCIKEVIMDTSETYIKMCDCEEIQELRPHKNYPKYEDGDVLFAHWPDGTSYPVEKRERRISMYTILGNNPDCYSKAIWLPHQDQLQEIVGYKGLPYLLTQAFERSVNGGECNYTWNNGEHFTSMEQLWLAFVMKEKFNKKWNGTEWVT